MDCVKVTPVTILNVGLGLIEGQLTVFLGLQNQELDERLVGLNLENAERSAKEILEQIAFAKSYRNN